jgi:hypothetical protein
LRSEKRTKGKRTSALDRVKDDSKPQSFTGPRRALNPATETVTSVRVTTALRKRLRIYAAENDLTLQAALTLALDEYLKGKGR